MQSNPPRALSRWRRDEIVGREDALSRISQACNLAPWDAAAAMGHLTGLLQTGWLIPEGTRYRRPAEDPKPPEPKAPRVTEWVGPRITRRHIQVIDQLTGDLIEMVVPVEVDAMTRDPATGEPVPDDFRPLA